MRMCQILEQIDGTVGIADGVAVYAKSKEEHDKIFQKLMQVPTKNDLVFSSKKKKVSPSLSTV